MDYFNMCYPKGINKAVMAVKQIKHIFALVFVSYMYDCFITMLFLCNSST